jgi:hypoxanthine phosphoribosyltransferase
MPLVKKSKSDYPEVSSASSFCKTLENIAMLKLKEKNLPKFLCIDGKGYDEKATELAKKIKRSGEKFDLVIALARGGIPIAMIVSDQLKIHMDIINVKSYTGIGESGIPVIKSTLTENINGKNILIVDDLTDKGSTMKLIKNMLQEMSPASIKTAALFRKPWSTFNLDFFLETTDAWVVFPWERQEVITNLKKLQKKY